MITGRMPSVSRRITRDFRVKYTRKHLAEHSPVNSSELLHEFADLLTGVLSYEKSCAILLRVRLVPPASAWKWTKKAGKAV